MKTLMLIIFLPSLFAPPTKNSETLTQFFPINHFTTSLIIEVNGSVEIEYWDQEKMYVESTIQSASPIESNYPLRYAIQKGYFDLVCGLEDPTTLILESKKINATIFQKGQKQKTNQSFKIFIPKRLQCTIR